MLAWCHFHLNIIRVSIMRTLNYLITITYKYLRILLFFIPLGLYTMQYPLCPCQISPLVQHGLEWFWLKQQLEYTTIPSHCQITTEYQYMVGDVTILIRTCKVLWYPYHWCHHSFTPVQHWYLPTRARIGPKVFLQHGSFRIHKVGLNWV